MQDSQSGHKPVKWPEGSNMGHETITHDHMTDMILHTHDHMTDMFLHTLDHMTDMFLHTHDHMTCKHNSLPHGCHMTEAEPTG